MPRKSSASGADAPTPGDGPKRRTSAPAPLSAPPPEAGSGTAGSPQRTRAARKPRAARDPASTAAVSPAAGSSSPEAGAVDAPVPATDVLGAARKPRRASDKAPAEPVPLEVPLEEQITRLPPVVYPGSNNEEFDRWAGEKRRNRQRLEVIGGALLLIAGVVVTIVSGRVAFVAVALFGVVGLVAYEFLVTSFE